MVKRAAAAGFSTEDICRATLGWHWTAWGPMSEMWKGWIDAFEKWVADENSNVRAAAELGIEWATEFHENEKRNERHQDIYGLSPDT